MKFRAEIGLAGIATWVITIIQVLKLILVIHIIRRQQPDSARPEKIELPGQAILANERS